MLTIGIDFAAQPANTVVAKVQWVEARATVRSILKPATDAQILLAQASREGWMIMPTCSLAELVGQPELLRHAATRDFARLVVATRRCDQPLAGRRSGRRRVAGLLLQHAGAINHSRVDVRGGGVSRDYFRVAGASGALTS